VASPLVVFFLSLFVTAYVSYRASERIRTRARTWIAAALAVNTLINLGFGILAYDYVGQEWSAWSLAVEGAAQFTLLFAASLVGYWFANRNRERFVLNRLVEELRPSDRRDLIELVKTLPSVKQA
jgi:hypothetical protein